MLDKLFEMIDEKYGNNTFFMGLAFKFHNGIAIIDKYFSDEIEDGFVVEFASYIDTEPPVSVVLKDKEELHTFLKEVAL
ncbi:hypothetical protein SECTIM467_8 [Brevibacillus phage SecTim467]|uniref:Uncharacterized protein n=2 Tax=Jenstvirus jenst TaxID=1982225 RepID=A0A0K2CPH0_9CAUD|nr:hypothetical protein AVV11_gp008 [Brevibacillus phage Jenst]ALA07138.1 hypothetical protein JENST_8 [Brevibacillus phage Jenst]ALA07510.1 hypothetical protein SECTIM467_8 [Brevibacillus phage SecTim467]